MKKLTLVAGLLAAVLCISACGNSNSGNGGNASGTAASQNNTVPKNTVNSLADLEGKAVGVQSGTTGDIFVEDIKDAKVERYDNGADAIQALQYAKIDAVMIDMETAKSFVARNSDLKILEEPFAEEEYAIAYAKDSELGKKIDEVLTTLKSDGTIDKIVAHWIGETADHESYVPDEKIKRDGTITMATNAEFPPYEKVKGGEVVGIDVDIMNAVCDKLGMELKIEDMEFDSVIPAVTSGKADVGVAGLSITEDRLKSVDFTQSYATSTQAIIVRAS